MLPFPHPAIPPKLFVLARWLAAAGVALAGALLWTSLHFPLPWLVGSLCLVALGRVMAWPLAAPPGIRQGGQWVIGTKIGLYFTPLAAAELLHHAGLVVAMALFSIAVGMLGAALMVRRRIADPATAFFSCLPGGASEMANLADRWHAEIDRVAAAHSTRMMLVVLIIPMVLSHLFPGPGTAQGQMPAALPVVWGQLPLLGAASLCGVALFLMLRLPNPWILGSLLPVAGLRVMDWPLSNLPPTLGALGQLCIGVALGCRFGPSFLRRAPAFVGSIALLSLVALGVTALACLGLAGLSAFAPLSAATLVLAFSPGGIAEMSITASQLNLGVPLVVAAHVTRVILLMALAPVAYRWFSRRLG